MPTPTSLTAYVTGLGIVEDVAATPTLFDGTDYDDGDTVIKKGIVISFDPSGYGTTNHAALSNLAWTSSGHTGTASRLAGFNGSGVAEYVTAGTGLTLSGGSISLTGGVSPWKATAKCATTTAGTLSTSFAAGQVHDGQTLSAGDRIVIKDQVNAAENGLYTANSSGAPTRATDAPNAAGSLGLTVWIERGTTNGGSTWTLINDPTVGGSYHFKQFVTTDPANIGFICQSSAGDFVPRTITAGSCIYVADGDGVAGNPTISLKGSVGVCGRLTLESGVPFSTTSQTAKSTVYWTPHDGNSIPIYDSTAGGFLNRASAEVSVAVPSTRFCLYDVFAYWTGSAVALETTNWTQTTASVSAWNAGTQTFTTSSAHGLSVGDYVGFASITGTVGTDATYGVNGRVWKVATVPTTTTLTLQGSNLGSLAYTSGGTIYRVPTARATGLTLTNGIYTKSGDSSRTYLGTGCTWGTSGQTEQSISGTDCKLLLWNNYNQLPTVAGTYSYASHSYSTTSWRFWNNDPANTIWSVSGQPTSAFALLACDGQGGEGYTALGFDSTTGNNNPFKNNNTYQVAGGVPGVWARQYAGLNAIHAVEFGAAGWASTYVSLQIYMDM